MLKKNYYILILIVVQYLSTYAQPSWEKVKTPSDFNLLKVFYLDSLHCWATGDSGVIMFSGDQGLTWEIQNSGVSNYISDVFFLNDKLGWALTFEIEGSNSDIRSKVLKTTDGGANWEINNYRHLNIILTSVFFQDSLHGWVGSKPSGISFTLDGGYNWFEATIDTGAFSNFPIEQINFSTPQYGFAVGGHVDAVGVTWSTSDSGATWIPHGIGADLFLDFLFLDSTRAVALTAELEGFYPTAVLDFNLSNNSWDYIDTKEYVYVTGLSLRTPSEIWGTAGHNSKCFVVSRDTFKTLELISTPDSLLAIDIEFADSLHGIAVGEGGYIFRYIPDDTVPVNEVKIYVPNDFILEQNFPNPFNPSTKINWQSPVSGWQTLKIYDLLGNEVTTLVNEEKPAGRYEVEFNPESSFKNLPAGRQCPASGIYFYQLRIGSFVETKKMLLLK